MDMNNGVGIDCDKKGSMGWGKGGKIGNYHRINDKKIKNNNKIKIYYQFLNN